MFKRNPNPVRLADLAIQGVELSDAKLRLASGGLRIRRTSTAAYVNGQYILDLDD